MFSGNTKKLFTSLLIVSLFFAAATLLATESFAKTMFVKPVEELALRRGQSTEYKIIGMVKAGSMVKVLEQTNDYARIRLKSGKEGWLLKRFLGSDLPPAQQLEKIAQENEKLKERAGEVSKKSAEASASLEETRAQLESVLAERNDLLESYQQLQKDTANVTRLKKLQEETAQANAELMEQVNTIKDENAVLKKEKNLDWFIAGAAVLAVGFLLGRIPSPAGRKKRGYLL